MRCILLCLLWIQCSSYALAQQQMDVGMSNNLPANHPSILLMHKAYQQAGYQMKLVVMPLERSAYESNKGKLLDAELSRTAEAAELLPNMIRVKVAIGTVRITAYSRNPAIKISSWQDLSKWRVDVLRGMYLAKLKMQGQDYTEVNTIDQAMQRLLSDRTDIAVVLGDEMDWLLQQQAGTDIAALQPDLAKVPIFHYVHERHAALVAPLEAALRELTLQH